MKNQLRNTWLLKRQTLPQARRKQSEKALCNALLPILKNATLVLSYSSIRDELSTELLNKKLLEEKRLALPRVFGDDLWIYLVENLEDQLVPMSFGILEPNPDLCKRIDPKLISLALIPGIAFDSANHRLGYGKGHYDRFLEKHKSNFKTIGIGFSESFSETPFPSQKHDVSLDQIVLV